MHLKGCSLATLVSVVLSAAPSSAGYEFSVSADSTNPFANLGAPVGFRSLYLWATCIESGLSAFEAGVTTTLPILGFSPRNGVMNAGTATELLLAVPGCPSGGNVNFLLGQWTVQDSGGTFCLRPSAQNNQMVAVDCQANPSATPDPIVRGYSSLESEPCVVGTSACSIAPEGATFQSEMTIDGVLPLGEPWSPTTPHLVVQVPSGFTIANARSHEIIRTLQCDTVQRVGWSPDGTWVLFQTLSDPRQPGHRKLHAVPLDGTPTTLAVDDDMGPILWGEDGEVYWWHRRSGQRHSVPAPPEWNPDSIPPRRRAVTTRAQSSGALDISLYRPGDAAEQRLPSSEPDANRRLTDQSRTGRKVLVTVQPHQTPPYSAVLNDDGSQVAQFQHDENGGGFVATSISPGDDYILAELLVSTDDAVQSDLYLLDVSGAWRIRVATPGAASGGRFSRVSPLLAYNDLNAGEVHVGRIALSWR